MTRLVFAIVAAAALICVSARPSNAHGNAPWCAVMELGTGDVEWDCSYLTNEACVPNVIAGNKGFCNPNPEWVGGHPPPGFVAPTPPWPPYTPRHRHPYP